MGEKMKHSPTPWTAVFNDAYNSSWIIRAGNGNKIAQVANWQDIQFDISAEENVKFIVLACNRNEELEKKVSDLEKELLEANGERDLAHFEMGRLEMEKAELVDTLCCVMNGTNEVKIVQRIKEALEKLEGKDGGK